MSKKVSIFYVKKKQLTEIMFSRQRLTSPSDGGSDEGRWFVWTVRTSHSGGICGSDNSHLNKVSTLTNQVHDVFMRSLGYILAVYLYIKQCTGQIYKKYQVRPL